MDDFLIILLVLIDGPKTPVEVYEYLAETQGEECSCGLNDIGLLLCMLVDAGDYAILEKNGKFRITDKGISCLLQNKTLNFIYKQKRCLDELSAAGRI